MNEKMTDYQFKKIIELVLSMVENSKSLDEAIEKIKKLLEKE